MNLVRENVSVFLFFLLLTTSSGVENFTVLNFRLLKESLKFAKGERNPNNLIAMFSILMANSLGFYIHFSIKKEIEIIIY